MIGLRTIPVRAHKHRPWRETDVCNIISCTGANCHAGGWHRHKLRENGTIPPTRIFIICGRGLCEWVSSFLTAHQHIIGYSVQQMVDSKSGRVHQPCRLSLHYASYSFTSIPNNCLTILKWSGDFLAIFAARAYRSPNFNFRSLKSNGRRITIDFAWF